MTASFDAVRTARLVETLRWEADHGCPLGTVPAREAADQLEAAAGEIAWLRDSTTAWLIEADFGGRPGWWSESDHWTGDAGAARRFGTEQEAVAYAKRKGVICTGATEHVFAADRVELLTERDALRANLVKSNDLLKECDALVQSMLDAFRAVGIEVPNGRTAAEDILALAEERDALRAEVERLKRIEATWLASDARDLAQRFEATKADCASYRAHLAIVDPVFEAAKAWHLATEGKLAPLPAVNGRWQSRADLLGKAVDVAIAAIAAVRKTEVP